MMKTSYLLLPALLLVPGLSRAQGTVNALENDFATRTSVELDWKLAKGLHLSAEYQLRTEQGLSKIDRHQVSLGLEYKFNSWLKGGLEYTFYDRYGTNAGWQPRRDYYGEPMNGLDPQGFIEVRETIMNLHEEGVTFLISSHILAELEKICTKIGMISHGELLEEITMEELHKNARRQIIIESEDQDAVYALLQANPAFPEVVKEGTRVILYGDVDLNKVMQLLVGNGITVESLNTVQETIEDHYIKLLGRGKI